MSKKKVAIIGAGFSGLSLAWALSKKNIEVEIFEASARSGGLLGTEKKSVLVESAANALLASENVELLLADIGVTPIKAGFQSNKRWIFRNEPRQMPLNFFEVLNGLVNILLAKVFDKLAPRSFESLSQWAERNLNSKFSLYLVSTVFQGVYGTSASNLSAKLILSPFFDKNLKSKRGQLKGSISAKGGMQEILDAITKKLLDSGVKIHLNSQLNVAPNQTQFDAIVVATSLSQLPELVAAFAPKASQLLKEIPILPLVSATAVFESPKKIKGFGCLFPEDQDFSSLGVLFNSDIFENRGPGQSETWILPLKNKSDEEVKALVLQDRKKLLDSNEAPSAFFVKQWPRALPLYGIQLEKTLSDSVFEGGLTEGLRMHESLKPLYLTGNYIGVIGLSKILDYNLRLANRIQKEIA